MKKSDLQDAVKNAMKQRDQLRVETLRGLISAIGYEEISQKKEDLGGDAILAVVRSEAKKRREQIEFAEKAGRSEMIDQCKKELAILEELLPSQLDASRLEQVIGDFKNKDAGINLGGVMKQLKEPFAGQYDAKLASEIAKRMGL